MRHWHSHEDEFIDIHLLNRGRFMHKDGTPY